MELKSLLERVEYTVEKGTLEKEVSAVVYDSRKVEKSCLFICVKGKRAAGDELKPEQRWQKREPPYWWWSRR